MDSAAEDLKDPKGGLDILLVRSRSQSFFLSLFFFFSIQSAKPELLRKNNRRGY